MIMVDELRIWPHARGAFKAGACHLTTDRDEAELHAFAHRLGLRRVWFQGSGRVPHYDLTKARRALALELGAIFVPAKEQARRRMGLRAAPGEAARPGLAEVARPPKK